MSSVIKYRPEIDGLRAVAVLAVIVFHFSSNWLPGGFTGVDIFFVLSGYLITTISCREIDAGRFSIGSFYLRRIKRILPPLYAVLGVVVVVGAFLLTAKDFSYLRSSLNYIVLFISNIYFSGAGDYFAPNASEMPLLHTWSLAVEEQFYFVWPVLLVVIYRWTDHFRLIVLTVLAVTSFVVAEYLLRIGGMSQFAYYSIVTRFGEILAGAILALHLKKLPGQGGLSRGAGFIVAFSGCLFLLCGFFLVNEKSGFPGLNALYPVSGTLLLLLSFSSAKIWTTELLSTSPAVYVGKISYSLYLWHWPVLAYMRYVYGQYELPLAWLGVAVLIILVLSVLSYEGLEKPIRSSRIHLLKAVVLCFALPSAILILSGKLIQTRLETNYVESTLLAYGGSELCHGRISEACVRGAEGVKPRVLVFGDSHAAHFNYFFNELGKKQGFSALVLTASSCGPAFDFEVRNLPVSDQEACLNLLRYVRDNFNKFDSVVIAGRWEFQFGLSGSSQADSDFESKFKETLSMLSSRSDVVLMSQVPLLSSNPFRIEKVRGLGLPLKIGHNSISQTANDYLSGIAQGNSKIKIFNLDSYFTSFEEGVYADRLSVYMDSNHLNQYGASLLGKIVADKGQFEVLVK
ncbi:acyltransferase family protein [Bdellovibrio bacteriovorus]|uniref:acyltransferase family protein n=1 Tax=Bdellovibrio bacteriovorus TaxID=959 RepID=UPI003AA8B346